MGICPCVVCRRECRYIFVTSFVEYVAICLDILIIVGGSLSTCFYLFFFLKKKTAYEMRICDWSSDVCSSDLRSVIGKMELDRTFEEREIINSTVVAALDEAALNWGVKVLRYEIKDLTPPNEILRAMQAQTTAEREKRALIAASDGRRHEQTNTATRESEADIARSEDEKQAQNNHKE